MDKTMEKQGREEPHVFDPWRRSRLKNLRKKQEPLQKERLFFHERSYQAGLGSRSRSRSRSEPGVFGSLEPEPEPEPLEKNREAGARAAWKKKSGAGAGKN